MPLGSFDLYDILTDIVPGSVGTILLVVLSMPHKATEQFPQSLGGMGGAVVIIGVSYVIGRIVRNVSVYQLLYDTLAAVGVIWALNQIYERSRFPVTATDDESEDILHYVAVLVQRASIRVYGFVDRHTPDLGGNIFESEVQSIMDISDEKLEDQSTVPPQITRSILWYYQDSHEVNPNVEGGLAQMKYHGFTTLYGTNTLYKRYTIVSEFYKGLMNSFFIFFFCYAIVFGATEIESGIGYPTLWTNFVSGISSPYPAVVVLLALLAGFLLTYNQHVKFEERRAISFVIDLESQVHSSEEAEARGG
ncbi:hypothetical protein [Halosimplex halophilum]|uniref:hypothetical protein n=1 Tax=Halosimplex halophilum TaxID=2559572 RepID=UPI00107F64AF|nr:hypothetical protein [Halosimplex halophilum]